MRRNVFVLSVFVVILITTACVGCSHESNQRDYRLDYYMDTIQGYVIISAVCSRNDGNGISVSSVRVETTTQSEKDGYYGKETEFQELKNSSRKGAEQIVLR